MVIEHLANDDFADVRQAAAVAAGSRVHVRPDRCLKLLTDLSKDTRRSVRLCALEGLEHATTKELASRSVRCVVESAKSSDLPTAGKAARVITLAADKAPDDTLDVCEDISTIHEDVQPLVLVDIARSVRNVYHHRPWRSRYILSRLSNNYQLQVRAAALKGLLESTGG
jgi:hypothetical protein